MLKRNTFFASVRYAFLCLFIVCLSFTGCGNDESPEDQIRAYIAAGETAAESRDIGGIKDLIAEDYADEHGRTRRDIVAVAVRYFYANRDIHLLTRIKELTFLSDNRAMLQLYVAMSGRDVDADSLLNVQADLYRFDLELLRDGKEWKLIRAEWHSAVRTDFF